ncbi:MAG: hypothetical protein ACRCUY_12450 [Thermoguttaceae bacterium]
MNSSKSRYFIWKELKESADVMVQQIYGESEHASNHTNLFPNIV